MGTTTSGHPVAARVMSPSARKLCLAVHLTSSVGWIGAALAYLVLAVAGGSDSPETVRGAWLAMELVGWFVVVPLAVLAFLTGLGMGLGTRWGVFRHYWVVISLTLTAISLAVLLLHMPDVSSTADVAREADDQAVIGLGGDVAHPAIGTLVLLVVFVLNLYKPKGMTKYGRRRLEAERRPVTATAKG